MSKLLQCGNCCALLSAWGVVQLTMLGILYLLEPVTLFEEAQPHSGTFNNYEEFKTVTKEGYRSVALNCFLAAVLYLITLCMSVAAIKKAKRDEAKELIESEKEDFELRPKARHQQSFDMSEPLTRKAVLFKSA